MLFRIITLFCIVCSTWLFANETDILKIKTAIKEYFKNESVIFLHIGKIKNDNYFVIIKNDKTQDRVTITKDGKILSITDDLSVVDEAEEGC